MANKQVPMTMCQPAFTDPTGQPVQDDTRMLVELTPYGYMAICPAPAGPGPGATAPRPCRCLSWHSAGLLVGLLCLLATASAAGWDFCVQQAPPRLSQAAPLIDKYLDGSRYFYDWNMPIRRSTEMLDDCRAQLQNLTVISNMEFGTLGAADSVKLLYGCTKVPGVFEQVPEKLRGVFWMKGNAMGEELAVLQNGQWFEEEQTYLSPFAPYMWAWSWGAPSGAPLFGHFYGREEVKLQAFSLATLRAGFSYKFSSCPGRPSLPWPFGVPGNRCDKDSSASAVDMTYATLQSHVMGDLEAVSQPEYYTLEEIPDEAQLGSKWYRGIYFGFEWMGRCKVVSGGSYELTKILDASGEPLEPYYSEFLAYMGSVPLLMWTGSASMGPIR